MGELIEKLESWSETLGGTIGSQSNPFITNLILGFGSNILTLLYWLLFIVIFLTSGLDIMYIAFPGYRVALNTVKEKVRVKFGKGGNGTGGALMAHTTRNVAANKADVYGVTVGMLYYLKSRAMFYFFFGMFTSIFFSANGIMVLVNKVGLMVRDMYMTAIQSK